MKKLILKILIFFGYVQKTKYTCSSSAVIFNPNVKLYISVLSVFLALFLFGCATTKIVYVSTDTEVQAVLLQQQKVIDQLKIEILYQELELQLRRQEK